MGKASGQTNMANSFQNQVASPGVSTPNVPQRVGMAPIGAYTGQGSPTQLPGQGMESRAQDWWDKRREQPAQIGPQSQMGGQRPQSLQSEIGGMGITERSSQAREHFQGKMPGQFGERLQEPHGIDRQFPGGGTMLSRALRGRKMDEGQG